MSSRKARQAIGNETVRISNTREYMLNGQKITLPPLEQPVVYTEQMLADLAQKPVQDKYPENIVNNACSISAALKFAHKSIAILNFANEKEPGGGFLQGVVAQEQQLCYCSDLYTSLTKCNKDYYFYNCEQSSQENTGRIIVSHNTIIRDADFNFVQPVPVTIITCAAVRAYLIKDQTLVQQFMKTRIKNIMNVLNELNVEVSILGAFGCGVFKNDVQFVAKCFAEEGRKGAKVNCFAIFKSEENLNAFQKEFEGQE
ncbi:Conserved_hypothetical protein [Hexamita inflata]|uniref:Microbial-type PARG catalytic domain-containing protein n=2 Tax=Hexamita inflata TaxID=28002 RepID=A0AA86PCA3_9EUKA|nr:Conserved hypothetical protein [Hexamita inflata]